ncbi:hypothetical protein ACFLXK_01935 [Chloroflexota bacterium]
MVSTSTSIIVASYIRGQIPELLAWLVGIVLAVVMVRQGGGKAEKLLLAGCSLVFAAGIISLLLNAMIPWMSEQQISAQGMGIIFSLVSGLPGLAAFVCLVLAYWFRFRIGIGRQESV